MSIANLNLGYCIDNVQIAEALEDNLKKADFSMHHVYGKADQAGGSLSEQLLSTPYPTLLLISDNFLKSASCMSGSLQLLQRRKEEILPIIIDGFDKAEPEKIIHTQFERVSDIIQYINYWQEQYLDLRRQKRQMNLEQEEAFHAHLRVVRSISGEAGEFLRLLRHMNFMRLDEFAENNYQALFAFLGKENEWTAAPQMVAPVQNEPDPIPAEPITQGIPGMEMLEQTSNVQDTPPILPENQPKTDPSERKAKIDHLISVGEKEQALELINQGLEEDPRNYQLLFQKSLLLSRMDGRVNDSLLTLDLLLQVRPVHLEGRFLRAELEEWQKEYHRARHDYEQVLELDPDHPTASFRLGTLLANHFQDEPLEAARVLEAAIAKDPNNAEASYQYALLLKHQLRRTEESLPYFERALSINPNNSFARLDLANAFLQLGRKEEAFESYQLAVELNPDLQTNKNDQKYLIKKEEPVQEEKQEESASPHSSVELSVKPESDPEPAWIPPSPEPEQTIEPEPSSPPALDPSFANSNGTNSITPPVEETYTPEPMEPAEPVTPPIEVVETLVDPPSPVQEESGFFSPPFEQGEVEVEEPEEDNTINALKDNLQKLELLLAERRRREKEALEARIPSKPDAKTVLITGATSGIGKATARKFAEEGYRIIITGRRSDRLMAIKDEFIEEIENTEVYPLPFDVRDLGSIQLALNRLPDSWKRVDVLINNAGKAKGLDPIHQGNVDHWNEMIDTNLKGLLYLTRAIAPGMVERGKGHIINVGSTAGKEVYPKGGVYCATKFAVDALTKAMRLDFHTYGVRVGQVSPGHVEETEFALVRFDGDAQKARIYDDFQPLKATDVAEAIYFIANQPPHVNIQDILMMGTQQASSTFIDRSGRKEN